MGRLLYVLGRASVMMCFTVVLWVQASPASAQGIEGVVTDEAGPVAGAEVTAIPEDGSSDPHTDTGLDGSYSLALAPGTYSIGVTPSTGSGAGYFEESDVGVTASGNTVVDPLLPASETTGQLSGIAEYQPNTPDAGVQVEVMTVGTGGQLSELTSATTDSAGAWNAGGVPAGTYSVSINPETHNIAFSDGSGSWTTSEDAVDLTTTVTITAGQPTAVNYVIPALSVLSGTTATSEDLGYLNAERARWGLPAGITANPVWSQACAAHDAYLKANNVLEHPETEGRPAYSPGGNWGGTHSILSEGSVWRAEANPWEDAPIHLNQLMTPELASVGIDASDGYDCMTTWPGIPTMLPSFLASLLPAPQLPAPVGTVFTYPGNGTTGLPPAEDAAEGPSVPGKFVGVPEGTIAGREIFVYEEGLRPVITAASLTAASGPVQIKWVDANTEEVGGYLTGAIVIPVKPLAANTTYTANVTLEANLSAGLPEVSHQWSFTTGPANPSGMWPGSSYGAASAANAYRPNLAGLKLAPVSFRAAKRGATISRSHTGATVSYSDSEAATTDFAILRKESGRTRGRSCVAPSHKLARARPCVRLIRVYVFSHRDKAGPNRFHFSGRIGRHALSPGRYELQAVAQLSGRTSSTINASSKIVK
jgi:hypothetical protein